MLIVIPVVLDSNVIVSGLAFPGGVPSRIIRLWRSRLIEIIVSDAILAEVCRVLPRVLKSRKWSALPPGGSDDWIPAGRNVNPVEVHEPALRDPHDLPILGTFLAAKADFLITGDKDLLALADRYPILTPAEFVSRFDVGA